MQYIVILDRVKTALDCITQIVADFTICDFEPLEMIFNEI